MPTLHPKLNLIGKTIEWLVFAVLVVIVLIVASPLLPTKGWFSFYVVVSGSMEPAIPTGSLVMITTPSNARNLQKGDVIAFTSPVNQKETITHRIFQVNKNAGSVGYLTKGDHNSAPDAWTVIPEQIKGKYAIGIPGIGYGIEWAKTPIGFAVIVGLPALVLALLQIKKIKEGIDEEVEKRTKKALQQTDPLFSGASLKAASRSTAPTRTNKLLTIAAAIIVSSALIALPAKPALAAFSSRVTIAGITLKVAETSVPPACSDDWWRKIFSGPLFKDWQNSWVDNIFDWGAFWKALGIPAIASCQFPFGAPLPPFGANFPFSPSHPPVTPAPTPTPSPTPTATTTPTATPSQQSSSSSIEK